MFMTMEIAKPKTPIAKIPIAEIFVTIKNSFCVGFLKECQTLLHFMKNDFPEFKISFVSIKQSQKKGF